MTLKPKILIIDNDTVFRDGLKARLIDNGYHVLTAIDNVEDGINAIYKHQPDGIVLDIQLKNTLGLDVLDCYYSRPLEKI